MYKARVDYIKGNNITSWDNLGLVQNILGQIPSDFIKAQAKRGERAISKAKAIQPLKTEPHPYLRLPGNEDIQVVYES